MNSFGVEPHHLGRSVLPVVLPGKGDMVVVAGDEATIGDGDAMGVAAEIGEHLRRPAEGLFGIDDPVHPPDCREMGCEAIRVGERRQFAEEAAVHAERRRRLRRSRNRRRNRRASGFTGRKKSALPWTQRDPSSASPPPGTTQWRCG